MEITTTKRFAHGGALVNVGPHEQPTHRIQIAMPSGARGSSWVWFDWAEGRNVARRMRTLADDIEAVLAAAEAYAQEGQGA